MSGIRLSERLLCAAGLIDNGAAVADVGSDHGRLPVWLLQNRKVSKVIATDISRDPLSKAMALAEHCGIDEGIEFVLCDGLRDIAPESVDTIVIAGMGGETILGILQNAEWTLRGEHRLILQPMSAAHELRKYLYSCGYMIEEEKLIRENGRFFTVIAARGGGSGYAYEPWEIYVSKQLLHSKEPLLDEYIPMMEKRLEKAFLGAQQSSKNVDRERALFLKKAWKGLSANADNKRNI